MDKDLIIIMFGLILLIGNLSGGYRLDEQVNYPHDNKHSIRLLKKKKWYLFFIDKQHRREFLRVGYIQEIAAYIEFFMILVIAMVFMIFNIKPGNVVPIIIFIALIIDMLYTIIMYAYYKIKYK